MEQVLSGLGQGQLQFARRLSGRHGASLTAEVVCFHRALERLRPSSQRVLDDPFAHLFLGPPFAQLLEVARRVGPAWVDGPAISRAMTSYIVCRHRSIDDGVQRALSAGARQCVLLGAGYDSRALRLLPLEVQVFELDEPRTQARKLEQLRRHGVVLPENTRFVAVDFHEESLESAFARCGLSREVPTVFVWEGVSMYLEPPTVSSVLATIRAFMAPGSRVLLDLWDPFDHVDPISQLLDGGRPVLRALGEPLRFAIRIAELESFARAAGLDVIEVSTAAELELRYTHGARHLYRGCFLAELGR
jgi:methyltransferase (TIGR00027 family)